jgi:hypothetical protein
LIRSRQKQSISTASSETFSLRKAKREGGAEGMVGERDIGGEEEEDALRLIRSAARF